MIRRTAFALALLGTATASRAQEGAPAQPASYPIELKPEEVREYPGLGVDFARLRLDARPVTLVPISCEPGVTGALLIGPGSYRYEPEAGRVFEGQFRAAMLRFNPGDLDAIVRLDRGAKATDRGAAEMGRHLLGAVFRHCWHRGGEALIPPRGAIAAVLYSKDHGDLLIGGDDRQAVVYSFTDRKALFEKR